MMMIAANPIYFGLSFVGRLVTVQSGEGQVAFTATDLPTEVSPR
jgi:hypothetical protein